MEIPRHWRLKGQRYNLTGTVCTQCGKLFFSPRPICDACYAPVETDPARFEGGRSRRPVHALEMAQR